MGGMGNYLCDGDTVHQCIYALVIHSAPLVAGQPINPAMCCLPCSLMPKASSFPTEAPEAPEEFQGVSAWVSE